MIVLGMLVYISSKAARIDGPKAEKGFSYQPNKRLPNNDMHATWLSLIQSFLYNLDSNIQATLISQLNADDQQARSA
jgi:hypothetical protein